MPLQNNKGSTLEGMVDVENVSPFGKDGKTEKVVAEMLAPFDSNADIAIPHTASTMSFDTAKESDPGPSVQSSDFAS